MITVRLKGGLGNQLFQYAAARALAQYHCTSVVFDLSLLSAYRPSITTRNYELSAFGIRPNKAPFLYRFSSLIQTSIKQLAQLSQPVTEYREESLKYDTAIWQKTSPNTRLTGYFQSELYFKDICPLLRQELTFVEQPPMSLVSNIQSTTSVSLHVRRGDFVSNPQVRQFHGICSVEYYDKAVDYLASKVGDLSLFVFSDDQDWARKNLNYRYPTTFVEGHDAMYSYKDMQLMSLCQHHIIANSSFSWWGAWLNPSPNKIIVAPGKWVADEKAQDQLKEIVPDTWIKIY